MYPIELNTVDYTVEVWDINNVMVADVSYLISTSLRINMKINDVESVEFSLDLVQFEKLCESIGARPINIIEPYRTDIKIRRNGEYLVGAHVVETNVNFNSQDTNKLEVRCLGYLNYFKDRYSGMWYGNKTYAQIAQSLVMDTQDDFNYVRDPFFDTGIFGWQPVDSAWSTWDNLVGHSLPGSLFTNISSTIFTDGGTQYSTRLLQGREYTARFWSRATIPGGTIYVRGSTGEVTGETSIVDTEWHEYTMTWTQSINSDTFEIRTTGATDFWIDEAYLTDNVDTHARRDFGVTLGIDYASSNQESNRVRDYDLQNVKDGIINLTKLENDNFDFKFDANKVFTTYARLGSDKPHVELVYPQNITSMSTVRTAQALANKIYGIGEGIGEERLEESYIDKDSASSYRVRERVDLHNSISKRNVLINHIVGAVEDYKVLFDNIKVNISNNTVDLNDVVLGDAIYLRVDGSTYVDYINGLFRIVAMDINVSNNNEESVGLELQRWS